MALVPVLVAVACAGDDDSGSGSVTTTTVATTTTTPALEPPTEPWVIAHRGASGLAPENTLAAFTLAVELDADLIELDLQMTSDGELVVLHDLTLDRTARGAAEDCTGAIDALTLAQVQSCDAGSWFNEGRPDLADPAFADERIPSLDEALARFGTDVRWYIETKKLLAGEGMEKELVASLEAAGFTADAPASQQVVVQSFEPASLRTVQELRPDLTLSYLISVGAVGEVDLDEVATYAVGIGPAWVDVDADLIAAAHERCLTVIPYTVDDPDEMVRLLDLGVDGIITNHPEVLRPLVKGRTHTPPCTDPAR